MQLDNYRKIRVLGEGTYGKCYLALDQSTGEHCVLKQIEIIGLTEAEIGESVREAHILEALDSDFIIKFLGSFQSKDGYLNILMSYAEGGDLSQRIRQAKANDQIFAEEQILTWFTQICLAIKHVHDRKIIHRDLKTQNIFLTGTNTVKLGDFGIAKHLQHTIQKIKSVVGTPYYMSPEICENKEYSFKADIWSLGVILLEMCLLKPPFDANSLPVLALKISKGEHYPVPKYYSRELKRLVVQLLQVDPAKRPTIAEILKNPLIEPRITTVMSASAREIQFSHTTLHAINIFDKMPSRGLFIDCNLESSRSPMDSVVSPKSGSQISNHKNNDMPVKRVDNYTKQPKAAERKGKRGEMMRKREISQPNLTPKNHVRIENQRKLMGRGVNVIDKKKSTKQKQAMFKKRSKNMIEEIELIKDIKSEITEFIKDQKSLRQPIQRVKDIQCEELNSIQERSMSPEESASPCVSKREKEETLLETLQSLILQSTKQTDMDQFYKNCEANSGICLFSQFSGLVTLAYAIRKQSN